MTTAAALFPDEASDGPGPLRLGDYRVLSHIAEGGMGIIMRGQDVVAGRIVALKTARSERPSDAAGIRREIAALQRVDHPGIVQLYDDGDAGGIPWLAMELLEGWTLCRTIVSLWPDAPAWLGTPPVAAGRLDEVLPIVTQLCLALEHLHGHGFVHRDIKPTNVMVGPRGRVTLFDFGLACRARAAGGGPEGRDICVGTMEYAAPEQICGTGVDGRADIYALGCMLYELCTGQRPFDGDSSHAVAERQLRCAPRPPSELVADMPGALEELLLRMLAKRADERPATAAEVSQHLTRIAAGLRASAYARLDLSVIARGDGGASGRPANRVGT
jgi:serine/threonine protein kinase